MTRPGIVVAATDPDGGRGGIAVAMQGLLPALQRAGALSGFLATHRSSPRARIQPALSAMAALPGLVRVARSEGRAPILYAHVGGPVCVLRTAPLAREAKALGAHVVIQLHSALLDPWLTGPRRLPLRALLAPADVIAAATEHYADRYRRAGLGDVVVLPNQLPPDATAALRHRPAVSSRRNALRLGIMTRLVGGKGVDLALSALAQLPGDSLHIAGTGPALSLLRDEANALGVQDRVTFNGWVTDKDAWFKNIDVFVLPSVNDTFGMGVLEAMARGVPVIAADTPITREVIAAGASLVPPSAHAIAHAVNALRIARADPARAAQDVAKALPTDIVPRIQAALSR